MRQKAPVAWMSTKFRLELPAALGLEVYCPESAAAAAAGRGESGALCRLAQDMGYAGDLCSYVRMGMVMAQRPQAGGLPRPDVLLCCDNICAGMVQWYRAMARTLQVPLVLVDMPYGQGERAADYVRGQLLEAVGVLEELTGTPWREETFALACRRGERSALAWQRVLNAAQALPSPLENMEVFAYMPDMVTRRCAPETEEKLLAVARALEERSAPRGAPRYRIFWEGTPCWPVLGQVLPLLGERGIQVVADTISHSLAFRCRDLDGLARAYCATINGMSLEQGAAWRAELCRRFRVDGVLVHYNRSCRPWCGALQEVERRLREELGVPVVSFQGDQGDPALFSLAQFATRLDALTEQMQQRRG